MESQSVWIHIFLWIIGGLMSLIVIIGGSYMAKLFGDIREAKEIFEVGLRSVHDNCRRENEKISEATERIAALEAGFGGMKDDLGYIRKRVDDIAIAMSDQNSRRRWSDSPGS